MDPSLQPVIDHIERKGGVIDECGLTASKVRNRAKPIEGCAKPGEIAFEIERHKGILGEKWEPGEGMCCYVTFLETYVYDPKLDRLDYIGRTDGKASVSIPYESVARRFVDFSLTVTPREDGEFEFRDDESGMDGTVSCVDELIDEVGHWINDTEISLCRGELEAYIPAGEVSEIMGRLWEACYDRVEEIVREAWDKATRGNLKEAGK